MIILKETNKITIGFKIHPHQNLDETLKKHAYPGFMNFCKQSKDISDLKYLKQDVNITINDIKKISERIEKIEKLGNCEETKKYYKGITNKFISKGITTKDCDLTLTWFKDQLIPEINQKIKELS